MPGKLLAGEVPAPRDPEAARLKLVDLLGAGIRCVINLTEEHETDYASAFESIAVGMGIEARHKRFAVPDMELPAISLMTHILDEIDDSIDEDMPVYVHCLMGIGRTGTVVGCYLVRHGLATGDDVLAKMGELRKKDPSSYIRSPVTDGQCAFVRSWHMYR
ncbi:MAG: dual specificity protein phosphatase family protein [Deltaproteobacteria bacterium]|nr:dual specificity protein phosphatase family protein [Deltaproteobacteria bacterium]